MVYSWATGWKIGDSTSGSFWEFFSSSSRPDRLSFSHSLLSSWCQGLFL